MGVLNPSIPGVGKLLGGVTTNADGSKSYTGANGEIVTEYQYPDGKVGKDIIYPDGTRTSDRGDGWVKTTAPDGSFTTKGPDGKVYRPDQIEALNEANSSWDWGDVAKTGARSIKEATEKLNPIGTPGLDQKAANDKIFGAPGADKESVFSDDPLGNLLGGVAGIYGLGGVLGGSGGAGGNAGGSGGAGGIDTSAIAAAAASSKAMQDRFLAEYNAAHPSQPPTMTATQLPPAVQADMMAQIKAAQAAGLDPISASHASATLLDPTQQAEQRARALGLEDEYGRVISGTEPSVAQLQLQQTLERNSANQLGLASKASGGGNVALALRGAANNIGRLNQGASSDAAILRAKEIDAARAGLGGVIDQTRGADINLAGKNADLSTRVSETNAGLDTNATLEAARLEAARRASNASLDTTTAMKDAELEAARRAAVAAASNNLNIEQGHLNDTASANNLNASIHQQEIDAAAKDAAAKNAISSGGQVITGTVGAADAQAKALAAAQAAKAAADAKQAAGLGALSSTVAAYLSSQKKSGASGTTYGANGSPILD